MEALFNEKMIRAELARLDKITGLKGATLPIKFGNTTHTLGKFACPLNGELSFYFSNYYFLSPDFPVEGKIDVIRHEYAHYMDYERTGSSSHGPSWKACCREIGALPIRCYNEDRSKTYIEKHRKEEDLNKQYDQYREGVSFSHPKFGHGRICSVSGEGLNRIASVSFESAGMKSLAVSWIHQNCRDKQTA